MVKITMKVPFNSELHAFLLKEGYTQIYNFGICFKERLIANPAQVEENDEFVVIPLKLDDPRLRFEDATINREDIKSDDVFDMAAGFPLITFTAEIDVDVFQKYLNS